jgi:uncharacterized protein (TIGR03435 family)
LKDRSLQAMQWLERMMMKHLSRSLHYALLAVALASPVMAHAQMFPIDMSASDTKADPNVKLPAYDVASVKENKSSDGGMRIMSMPDGFSCSNVSLKTLVGFAYGIRQDLISGGPGWAASTGFDVDAKVAPEDVEAFKKLSPRQRNSLLQNLLEERFQLKLHKETKTLTMYDLEVAKGGPKLKAAVIPETTEEGAKMPDDGKLPGGGKMHGRMMMGPGMFQGQSVTMQAIANQMSSIVHYTVVDKTGLKGEFDVDLKWSADQGGSAGGDSSADAVSIFTAVQEQLGLKLQSTKGLVETVMIDHAEMPTAN